eukprot:CAMPEP_0198226400 /NCGR_PEP_ID=MMETSP1445-20131203/105160_1 /TAXON_ID=36898 /ORGANISM="Pyramimonas sp., Strain CCMP2087" /LENGTH=347 /DNA_ID=CAMNT_0043906201 /DNA_START=194 /DNA_END=1234 /DNA_ORIENTATION=+
MTFIGPELPKHVTEATTKAKEGHWGRSGAAVHSNINTTNVSTYKFNGKSHGKRVLLESDRKSVEERARDAATASVDLKWNTQQRAAAGLRNLGNTCYLNSVLQCITHTPPLANLVLQRHHTSNCPLNPKPGCAFCLLENHILRCLNLPNGQAAPTEIYAQLKSFAKDFTHGRQEDAHELLRYAIEALHQSCLKQAGRKEDGPAALGPSGQYKVKRTVIENMFGGVMQSQVKCLGCGFESNTNEPIMDLSLEVGGMGASVTRALGLLTAAERLDGQNKYRCGGCKKLQAASKRLHLLSAPNILVVHLKRFDMTFAGKIQRHVAFEEILRMDPHMSPTSLDRSVVYGLY